MDKLLPSQQPPAGIPVEKAPLFVTMGFDDNGHSGLVRPDFPEGVRWASEFFASLVNPAGNGNAATFDGEEGSCTFYQTTTYIAGDTDEPAELVRQSWQDAYGAGHEIGCHTHSHPHGHKLTIPQWESEIELCLHRLELPTDGNPAGIGIDRKEVIGFRTPYLEYNDNTFHAVKEAGFAYDCSIEEGFQHEQDGTDFFWPYTMDEGSPGNAHSSGEGDAMKIGSFPGLWEMPSHAVVVPPDELCEKYGIAPGFRERLKKIQDWFFVEDGKITGLDYNLAVMFEMNKAEWLAVLKYTFDLRREGNRAPMLFGGHTDVYATGYDICPNLTIRERQEVIEQFFHYVLQFPEVRVVSVAKVLQWMRNPKPLEL